MRFALIVDTFPPEKNSAAVQLSDLADELVKRCDELTILMPGTKMTADVESVQQKKYTILKLKTLPTKDINWLRRSINEFLMPFIMIFRLIFSTNRKYNFDVIIWYSPSIFHGPLVAFLKWKTKAKSYLIIRDIFPEWAADLGLMSKGIPYIFFKAIAEFQYSIADVIAVQTPGNKAYFAKWMRHKQKKVTVLENWLAEPKCDELSIDLASLPLVTKKIAVYAGNMGVAQGVEILLKLAQKCLVHPEIIFLFVGRGSELANLQEFKNKHNLRNVYFFDEIESSEIPALYKNSTVGLLALSHDHKTHNIPGKFISYMQSGLPCFGIVNSGNDLISLVKEHEVGCVIEEQDVDIIYDGFIKFIEKCDSDLDMTNRCTNLFSSRYHVKIAVDEILETLRFK